MSFPEEVNKIIEMIKNKIIPDSYPESLLSRFDPGMDNYGLRDIMIELMGYALIAKDWIAPLSLWIGDRNCLEVMSGSGALAYALRKQNIKIIPTDNFSGDDNFHYFWKEDKMMWVEVEKIDAISAVKKYGRETDIVILSWPFMNNTATEVLETMRSINPDCIMIYIGEGREGCTANSKFFKLAEPIEDEGFENAVKKFKQWNGIHDSPRLFC
jgi:hypothetical protein